VHVRFLCDESPESCTVFVVRPSISYSVKHIIPVLSVVCIVFPALSYTYDAYIYIDKELQRASLEAIKTLDQKDIIRMFPLVKKNPTTVVVLKTPKTQSSVRRVWLPKTVAYILREFREKQNTLKELLQDEYEDYNLVIPMNSGRPCEDRVITESFQRLRERVGLPNVVFHSLRHSSTT